MNAQAVNTYRDLIVWQKSVSLTTSIYETTQSFPREEVFGLTSQVRRAVVWVPANIAEGNARGTRKDYGRCLFISRDSLAELETHLIVSNTLGFLPDERLAQLREAMLEIQRMLNALIRSLGE